MKYTCLPGHILAYYPENQTADVQISAEEIRNSTGRFDEVRVRPPIVGLPVHVPSAGGWAITMPVAVGDSCVVMFSQVGLSHWLKQDLDEAGVTDNGDPHPNLLYGGSYSEGLVMMGFNTEPRAITDHTMDGSQWRNTNSTQSIHLKADGTIQVDTPANVVVNCTQANITATDSTLVTTPQATITGNLNVGGNIEVTGTSLLTGVVTGTAAGSTFGTTPVDTHTHKTIAVGSQTAPPTPPAPA